jgi:hypothetical protein
MDVELVVGPTGIAIYICLLVKQSPGSAPCTSDRIDAIHLLLLWLLCCWTPVYLIAEACVTNLGTSETEPCPLIDVARESTPNSKPAHARYDTPFIATLP